ncbi:MAG TPA: tRNA lysidine(34) synthetase TilS [Gemmatimonadota bacterium]|nr:tRNA lysidine(34) synthetase TilS [Gemmatimonadota bacterium]
MTPRPTGDLPTAFRDHWLRHFAPPDGERLVVGVSGGIDSMTLLALLGRERAGGTDLEVVAAHFDHGARGPAGAEDGRFVEAIGAAWGTRVVRGAGDAPARARESGRGPMAAARELRYEFLRRVAEDEDAWAIATAHQRDDRVETLLLRITRGASTDGLGGPRAIDDWGGTPVIRPLLPFSRTAIEEWAGRADVPFRKDPSNVDRRYPRSRMRNEVLPLLREINPRIDAAVVRLSDLASVDAAWLRSETGALLDRATTSRDEVEWRLDADMLSRAPEALLGRAIVTAWSWSAPEGTPPPAAAWIEGVTDFLRGGRGGLVPAPGGGEIRRRGPAVIVRRAVDSLEGATGSMKNDGEESAE